MSEESFEKKSCSEKSSYSLCLLRILEAEAGIEPAYTALQAAA